LLAHNRAKTQKNRHFHPAVSGFLSGFPQGGASPFPQQQRHLRRGQLDASKNCWLMSAWRDSLAFAMSGGSDGGTVWFL
jgi:hypothetical protein